MNTAETHCIKERSVSLDEVLIGEIFLVLISETRYVKACVKKEKTPKHEEL